MSQVLLCEADMQMMTCYQYQIHDILTLLLVIITCIYIYIQHIHGKLTFNYPSRFQVKIPLTLQNSFMETWGFFYIQSFMSELNWYWKRGAIISILGNPCCFDWLAQRHPLLLPSIKFWKRWITGRLETPGVERFGFDWVVDRRTPGNWKWLTEWAIIYTKQEC